MAASVTCKLHPEHSLTRHHYGGEGHACVCALCERIIAGAGYRCGEQCGGFDAHEACLSLPMRIAVVEHPAHELTLSLLTASRWCDACRVASHAGCCVYRCVACDFDVHARCTSLLDGEQQHGRKRGVAKRVGMAALRMGFFGLRVADAVTGGFGSPVIEPAGDHDASSPLRRLTPSFPSRGAAPFSSRDPFRAFVKSFTTSTSFPSFPNGVPMPGNSGKGCGAAGKWPRHRALQREREAGRLADRGHQSGDGCGTGFLQCGTTRTVGGGSTAARRTAASGNHLTESRTHFAHPQHPLLKTQYGGGERQPSSNVCRIYRCGHCDFDMHEACADFFPEKMITPPPNFFGHPWSHNLALRQVTANRSWPCTLCRGPFQHGHLAYRCGAQRCGFAAHPLCTMLPGDIRSPLHRKHALTHTELIPSRLTSGPCAPAEMARVCSVCRRDCSTMRTRHYRCAASLVEKPSFVGRPNSTIVPVLIKTGTKKYL
uniref:Phorbol-ester/DAG-type domain-containing protein n=1 Tax=Oryza meridionalis TaxID=40149 RepID=A0A0E0EE83_9ORYZ